MISTIRYSMVLLVAFLGTSTVFAQGADTRRDTRALEVLQSMSAYTAKLDRFAIRSNSLTDARLSAGLIVSNAKEGEMIIDRKGSSLYIAGFDGEEKQEIFFDDGRVTIFNSEKMFYGQADIPEELEAAVDFALEELDIEAPLMDLIYRDVTSQVTNSDDAILYLTDKSRIDGVDCHHIAIRGDEVDLQLWIEEGDQPLPRMVVITSKWEGGSPRFISTMSWDTTPKIDPDTFKFKAPKGATNIGFVKDIANP